EIAPLEANWDVAIDCHQANLACGIDLRNIFGTVRLRGETDGARSWSAGELQLDSVTFQDVQFTNIRGPLYVNETKCLLGKWATDQQQQPERRVTGNVYDGSLAANAWVTFDNLPEYRAEVRVQGADLRRIVVERFGRSADYAGKVDADVRLGGRSTQLDLLVGEGDVHIRDANLYELSLLASLLKMLRTGEANKTAFTHSDVAFRLQGRHIYLDKIDFLGDVVNLYGSGETNFDQQLALKFSAVVGRHDYRLPMVKTLMREANQQILQMYVNGTLAQPEVTTEAFPGLAQMFNQIGQDLRRPAAAIPRLQAQPPGRVAVQPAARQ
ncbi:MAG TPA: AsmA-like C-terminal region-containing protein, partial [Lacipirellulaceae bacterium]|nr:AsmA-like C-terminal region-containing protein [Lacipirellulaceae bacterium]